MESEYSRDRFNQRSDVIKLWMIIGILTLPGCSTPFKRLHSARDLFAIGKIDAARESLEKVTRSHSRYAEPAALDLAIIDLADGKPAEAERRLRSLRDQFDKTPDLEIGKEFLSMASDDTALSFRPAADWSIH